MNKRTLGNINDSYKTHKEIKIEHTEKTIRNFLKESLILKSYFLNKNNTNLKEKLTL